MVIRSGATGSAKREAENNSDSTTGINRTFRELPEPQPGKRTGLETFNE